jgi:hypothetical protein
LREAYPRAGIAAFALVRTRGLEPNFTSVLDPCEGLIRLVGEEADRQP